MKVDPYQPPPCIIVPVYNAPRETEACLRAVIRETHPPYRLLVLDDASSDPAVADVLSTLEREYATLELHRQPYNLGFAANVNYGMALAKGDVVLLNSDTIVSDAWLDKLVACAYSRSGVATVTPLSNGAGAFSVPENNIVNFLPQGLGVNAMAALVTRASAPLPVTAPTGNGFCLYIRRDALQRLGLFDAETFPHVCEENDFSQRALAAGLVNLVDSSCYVYHSRSASFGGEQVKAEKMAAARAVIDQRYPNYKKQVATFLRNPELETCRKRLRNFLGNPEPVRGKIRPRVLSVIHAGGGGMVHTNRDLMRTLIGSFDTYELRCDLSDWRLTQVSSGLMTAQWRFGTPWRPTEAIDAPRRMTLQSIVKILGIDLIHVRSLIGVGPEIFTSLKRTGIPVVCSFHDFAAICPTIQLIDEKLRYCGGHCTPSKGDCRVVKRWFGNIRDLKHQGVYQWRERMAANLPLANAFVTTAESTRELLIEHFPALAKRSFLVIEHGRDREGYEDSAVPPQSPLKVVAFGALNYSKGAQLLEALFKTNAQSGGDVEFHLLGGMSNSFRTDFPHVICHGPYERETLPRKLRQIEASYALICSIWPETYCHTLTEAWMAGLPVLASDIGVLAERITQQGGGRLVDPQRPDLWFEALGELRNTRTWRTLHGQVQQLRFPGVKTMAQQYEELYWELLT